MTTISYAAEVRKGIEYARPEGISLRFDASIPEGKGPFPAAILVHGGGWVRGDRSVEVAPLFKPLSDAGIAWFSIDYRLATDLLHFGVAIDDVIAAVHFVKAHAAEYHIDPDRIALIGESAGGQLAAMAALTAPHEDAVRAVVALYAPTDLVALLDSSGLIPSQIRERFKGTPLETLLHARLKQLSPISNLRRDAPPFLLIHGTADPLVPFETIARDVRGHDVRRRQLRALQSTRRRTRHCVVGRRPQDIRALQKENCRMARNPAGGEKGLRAVIGR